MLNVYLTPLTGNASNQLFPTTGYLGVTPVVVAGTCSTKPAEGNLSLHVRRIYLHLRCCEERLSGPFAVITDNIIWQTKEVIFEDEIEMREWSTPFKLTIPPDVSAHSSQGFKEWRVIWKMDVVIEHEPVPLIGTRTSKVYTLGLYNHRLPSIPPPSPLSPFTLGTDTYAINVSIVAPHLAAGPGDTVNIGIQAQPADPSCSIRKTTVCLERRLDLHDKRDPSPESRNRLSSLFRSSTSPYNRIESPELDLSGKSIVSRLAEVTSDKTGNLAIKLPPRSAKWDYGETLRTKLVTVTFDLRVKIAVKHKKGVKELSCPPVPVTIVATSVQEREEASKAVHPRKRKERSKRGLYIQQGTIEISNPVVSGRRTRTRSQPGSPIFPVVGTATNVQSILLPPNHTPQPRPITFTFPAPPTPISPPSVSPPTTILNRQALPSISALLNPASPDDDVRRRFQASGRRISTTASEEEETQPSRSRQRTDGNDVDDALYERRPSLNNMDALGLGLPHVEDDRPRRRPVTAPAHYSTFTRPLSSGFLPPPPLSGYLSTTSFNNQTARPTTMGTLGTSTPVPDGSFAFTVTTHET